MKINYRIEAQKRLKEAIKKYQDFVKQFDLNPIVDYFKVGLEAKEFKDQNGKLLTKNDNLWWGFNHAGYQYTLRRQPLNNKGNDIDSLMNQLLQGDNNKE